MTSRKSESRAASARRSAAEKADKALAFVDDQRPSYSSPSKPVKVELAVPPPMHKLRGQLRKNRMQRRIVVHTVGLSSLVLLLALVALLGTGLWQTVHFSQAETKEVVNNFRVYSERFAQINAPGPDAQKHSGEQRTQFDEDHYMRELIRSFIVVQNPPSNSSLLGFVGGDLIAREDYIDSQLKFTDEFLSLLRQKFSSPEVQTVSLPAGDGESYFTSIVPVQISGSETNVGHLVIVYNFSRDVQRIKNQIQLFAGVSLFILTVVSLITLWSTTTLLAPIVQLRHMLKSIITQQDLSKRLPVREEDYDLSEVSRQANLMIERMQNLFKQQNELLNDAGHELRTPITVVRGHLELMDATNPQEVAETRKLLLSELDHMERLTDDLVTVAKTDTPGFIAPEQTNLGDLLLDVYEQASMLGDFRWRIEHLDACEAVVDPGRIRQVLLQLAQNATKFSEPGSIIAFGLGLNHGGELLDKAGELVPTSEVSAPYTGHVQQVPAIDSPYFVSLWVRDTGRGIDSRNQARIFERFVRVDHSVPGSGLGLAIASAIAEAHRGTLSLRSYPGVGSLFTLKIPISEQDFAVPLEGEENE